LDCMIEKKRFIFHLDMDHFYTAVEERERHEIKGNPVIVGSDPKEGKGRGVVSTSNYEARKVGVRSGMPISQAWRLCPKAVYLPPNFPLYIKVSGEIMAIARKHAVKFEQWGIDETFLDVTGKVGDWDEAEALARQIKQEIKDKENLTASIGVGPNKIIAKIASDFQKPDGLTIVKEVDVQSFLDPLPVRKLLWVGRKTEAKLKTLGINTIGDLARYDPTALSSIFGVIGLQMHLMAKGNDRSKVEERVGVKSVSHETTFEEDTSDSVAIVHALNELCEAVQKETTSQHLLFKTVTVKIRYQGFETHTKSKTLPRLTNRIEDLKKTASELIAKYIQPERKMRLIGVRVSSLVSFEKQKALF
jgi:DNA polymerase IV (archaeal DinB-like DNA polymerase)